MEIIPTQKIINRDGVKAVKNGQKRNQYSHIPNLKKPEWLKVKAQFNPNFHKIKNQVSEKGLTLSVRKRIVLIFLSAGLLARQLLCSWAQYAQGHVSFVQ